ncbi:MAG: hypothetical protein AAF487_10455 [Bacteroidota bacterium]
MKYAAAFILSLFLFACSHTDQHTEEIKNTNEQLLTSIQSKNAQISELMKSIKDIRENLDDAKSQQGLILTAHSGMESPMDLKASIIEDIELLHQLIEDSKWDIKDLEKNLNRRNAKNEELRLLLTSLKENLQERDKEILNMKEQLIDWDAAYAQLSDELDIAVVSNEILTDEMNRVYFTCGTYKELKGKGVVQKKGGILGVGGNKDLKDGFSKNHFTEVDLRDLKRIPINAKKLEIITPHDEDSYYIEMNEEHVITELVIHDKEKFWNASKYLTIVVNQ